MKQNDLEDLRDKVSCIAVLEAYGWKIDCKESSKLAVKYPGQRVQVNVPHKYVA